MELDDSFEAAELSDQPALLASESARRWLVKQGVPPDQTSPQVLDRLIRMAHDAASPSKVQFPGGIFVCRSRGVIRAI